MRIIQILWRSITVNFLLVTLISCQGFNLGPSQTPNQPQGAGQEQSQWTHDEGIRLDSTVAELANIDVVADASVLKLSDGSFRAYFFAQGKGVLSATSSDGLSFALEEGARLPDGNGMPRAWQLDDGRVRLYVIGENGIKSAISDDGLTFTMESGMRMNASDYEGIDAMTGISIVKLDDGNYRAYFSDLPRPGEGPKPHKVMSATSSDLLTWTPDEGVRLGDGSALSASAEHPFIVRRPEGGFRIFYFVNHPIALFTATSSDGLTFENARNAGITGKYSMSEGNDPDIVEYEDGKWRLYYGDFSPDVGGFVRSATADAY